jgi:4-hydroxybenzoate polyprenyltransferase
VHNSPTRPRATDDVDALPGSRVRLVVDALRPHQWVKNLLLIVPPLAAHRFDGGTVAAVSLAFVSLSLCASGGYVLNDLLDLAADRQHHRKRHRPFASGRLSVGAGALMIILCWAAGFGVALALLPPFFVVLTIGYVFCTAAYSLWLKREPVLDVMFLAGLYVVRVIAGGAATDVPVSSWLLAFTLFVCLSLAFLKRFIEVHAQRVTGTDAPLPGRGYVAGDAPWLQSAGLTSAYLAVVVLAIYVNNADLTRLYAHPQRLLLVCPVLLFWATRSWLLAHRRKIHDDPVVAVAADPVTYVLGAIVAVVAYSAI